MPISTTRDGLLPKVLLIALLCSSVITRAQEARPLDHGSSMLEQGLQLERDDKNAEALALYGTVHRSDSLYERILLRKVVTLYALERYEDLIPLCDEGVALEGDLNSTFRVDKGLALVELKRYDEAVAVDDATIEAFPGLFQPRRIRALALSAKGDRDAYIAALEENAIMFPYQQEAHLSLAAAAQQEGLISQAALSLMMGLIVQWGNDRSRQTLGYLDDLLAGKLDDDPKGSDLSAGDDFSELDVLLTNKVAMNKAYKVKPDLTYAFVRQGQFLLTSLKDHPKGDGFWTTYYVPFMVQMMKDGWFEAFVYHALSNSNDPKIRGIADKKKAEIVKFRDALLPLINTYFTTYPDSIAGKLTPVAHFYNNNSDLYGYGEGGMNASIGPWTFYDDKGYVLSRGSFDSAHNKDGTWEYFHPNGQLMRQQTWNSGVENGTYLTWYPNGSPKDSATVVDGKAQGTYTQYAELGAVISRKTFTDGEFTGPAHYYFNCGTLSHSGELTDDLSNGEVLWSFPDGNKKFLANFKDDKRIGHSVEYFHNGQTASDQINVDGKRQGPFTEWFANGQKKAEGTYTADLLTGKRTVWYASGILSDEQYRDDQGRAQGTWVDYTQEGWPQTEMEYNKDLLIRYRYFDHDGKVLSEGKRSKGRFEFTGYTPFGAKRMQGSYLDEGAKDGPWTWWYPDGTVRLEENMKAGNVDGEQKAFRASGKLSSDKRFLPGEESTGPYTQYYPDGTVQDQGWLEDGELNGEQWRVLPNGAVIAHEYFIGDQRDGWQQYLDRDSVLLSEESYAEGDLVEAIHYDSKGKAYEHIKVGPGKFTWQSTYPDGKVNTTIEYVNGVRHGVDREFYPDGSKRFEGGYFNDKPNGTWKYWYPNGQPWYERHYVLGDRAETETIWSEAGPLKSKETYENGESTGYTLFHANGKPAIERPRRFGQDHGAVRSYDPSGELELVRYYSDGRLTGYSYNGTDGKLLDTIPLGEGLAELHSKYANGKASRDMKYRNGEIDGNYKEYHPNGQLMEESLFEAGIRVGESREFNADGTPLVTNHWLNDDLDGEQLYYWPNGKLRKKSHFVDGEQHGTTTLYDKAGKVVLVLTYRDDQVIAMKKP